jgi:excisionase family DNA binding protein
MKTTLNAEILNDIRNQTLNDTRNRLLGKREMAPQLRISKRTLDLWMRKGFVPYLKIGGAVRFKLDDVLEKLSQHRVN